MDEEKIKEWMRIKLKINQLFNPWMKKDEMRGWMRVRCLVECEDWWMFEIEGAWVDWKASE